MEYAHMVEVLTVIYGTFMSGCLAFSSDILSPVLQGAFEQEKNQGWSTVDYKRCAGV